MTITRVLLSLLQPVMAMRKHLHMVAPHFLPTTCWVQQNFLTCQKSIHSLTSQCLRLSSTPYTSRTTRSSWLISRLPSAWRQLQLGHTYQRLSLNTWTKTSSSTCASHLIIVMCSMGITCRVIWLAMQLLWLPALAINRTFLACLSSALAFRLISTWRNTFMTWLQACTWPCRKSIQF